jgi:hypothetical protein
LGIDDIKVASASLPTDLIAGKAFTNYTQLPFRHAAGKINFSALVKKENATLLFPAELNVTVAGTNYQGSASIPTSLGGVEELFTASPAFSPAEAGEYTANFTVVSDGEENVSNNTTTTSFRIGNSVFATEKGNFTYGISGNGANATIGNLYELKVADIIKSFSIAFETVTSMNFTVSIYLINPANYQYSLLYTSQTFNRNVATKYNFSEFVFDMPQQLDPGLYLFTVNQLTSTGMQIATDGQPGTVYSPEGEGTTLLAYSTLGNLGIRVNTVPTMPDLVITDVTSSAYRQTPIKHLGDLKASVKNIGKNLTTPATLNVTAKNTEEVAVYSGSATIPITLGTTAQSFTASPSFAPTTTGLLHLVFETVSPDGEGDPSNNKVTSNPFLISNNTFATDNGVCTTTTGVGHTDRNFGYVFELKQPDVITAFQVAFKSLDYVSRFVFRIFKVNNTGIAFESETPLFESEPFDKSDVTTSGIFYDFPIVPKALAAGKYFFAIYQLETGISVARDTDAGGDYYVYDPASRQLHFCSETVGNIHNIMFRVNTEWTEPEDNNIHSIDASSSAVYPTLTKGIIHVKTAGKATIKLIDLSGKTLASYSSTGERSIDLNYANGIYFVVVENSKTVSTHKVILQK